PVAAGAADPGVEDAPAVELDVVAEAMHQVNEFRLRLWRLDLVRHLERYGDDAARVVGQGRRGQQDQVRSAGETAHDFGGGFLARKLAEKFLDVLNLEGTLLELVLIDLIFHGSETG